MQIAKTIKMKILLIVTGGIAAVKMYDFVRLCASHNHDVRVILTDMAQKFVTSDAFDVLTGHKTISNHDDDVMAHISVARWADMILVAPATANIIGKMAVGIADDFASTLIMAADCPIFMCPAMNPVMWNHFAVQKNIEILRNNHIHIIMPDDGMMACGGTGRMREPMDILNILENHFSHNKILSGKKIIITAGATIEPIDPVRYISNHSSGKQGYSVAEMALNMGGEVFLVTGNASVTLPKHYENSSLCHIILIQTAQNLYDICDDLLNEHDFDISICAAAVCDWRCDYAPTKYKKQDNTDEFQLKMIKNPDTLYMLSTHKNRPKVVAGFAAETDNHDNHALQKLNRKQCDIIFMNDVSKPVFGADNNDIYAYDITGKTHLHTGTKSECADKILHKLTDMYDKK